MISDGGGDVVVVAFHKRKKPQKFHFFCSFKLHLKITGNIYEYETESKYKIKYVWTALFSAESLLLRTNVKVYYHWKDL